MKSSVTEAVMSIVRSIVMVGAFLLWAFAVNAGTNSYNGCVLAMTGIAFPGHSESEINEVGNSFAFTIIWNGSIP
jgi:hypothetical protein